MTLLKYALLLAFCATTAGITSCSNNKAQDIQKTETKEETKEETSGTTEAPEPNSSASSIYDFKMKDIDGKEVSLSSFKDKVVVFVNVASKCGYTKQYTEIEQFYKDNKDKGVIVLGFPANNFMGQEPGTDAEIKTFCSTKYNVTFPIFSKISVKGKDQHPLYAYLTSKVGEDIKWNFNKIVVDKKGIPVKHFASGVEVTDKEFIEEIKKLM